MRDVDGHRGAGDAERRRARLDVFVSFALDHICPTHRIAERELAHRFRREIAAQNVGRMAVAIRSFIAEFSLSAKRGIQSAEVCDQSNRRRRTHVEDSHHIRRCLVDTLRPVVVESELQRRELLLNGVGDLGLQSVIGMKNVVAGGLVTESGPGHDSFRGVRRRHVDDAALQSHRRRGVDRKGVWAERRIAPLHERRQDGAVRHLDASAILRAQESVIEIGDDFLKRVGGRVLESFAVLEDGVRNVEHQSARSFFGRIVDQYLREFRGAEGVERVDEWLLCGVEIQRRQSHFRSFDALEKFVEVDFIGRAGIVVQRRLARFIHAIADVLHAHHRLLFREQRNARRVGGRTQSAFGCVAELRAIDVDIENEIGFDAGRLHRFAVRGTRIVGTSNAQARLEEIRDPLIAQDFVDHVGRFARDDPKLVVLQRRENGAIEDRMIFSVEIEIDDGHEAPPRFCMAANRGGS